MAREVAVTLVEEDEDSWKVRCLAKLYRARPLSFSTRRTLSTTSPPLALYIFTELCERPRRKYISTGNASSVLDLAYDIRPPSTPISLPVVRRRVFEVSFQPIPGRRHVGYITHSDVNRRVTVSCCLCEHTCRRLFPSVQHILGRDNRWS